MIITPLAHKLIPVPVPNGDTTPVMETLTTPLVRQKMGLWVKSLEKTGRRVGKEGNAMPAMLCYVCMSRTRKSQILKKSTMLQGIDPWVRAWLLPSYTSGHGPLKGPIAIKLREVFV